MIKGQGRMRKAEGFLYDNELQAALNKLPDNQEFEFLIVDKKRNRVLPYVTYLFSVVLPQIAEQLPDHPATESLYRYFEDMFAPLHTCTINGEVYEWTDLKREKSLIIENFTEKVLDYARRKWNITVMSQEELQDSKNSELYSQAYKENEVSWAKFISKK